MNRYGYDLEALIIDPDMATRVRLKQATTAVPQFGKVLQANSIDEADQKLKVGEAAFNVVFISNRFPNAATTDFITAAKKTAGGQDAAYILVLEAKSQDSSTVASTVLVGADGLLFEPYSIDQLVEITNLAAAVKAERGIERERAAFRFLLGDVMNQLDLIAQLKSNGMDMGPNLKRLREMCLIFTTLEGESKTNYLGVAGEMFEKAPVPKPIVKRYRGVSERVKKRTAEKTRKQLAAAAAAATTPESTKR